VLVLLMGCGVFSGARWGLFLVYLWVYFWCVLWCAVVVLW
jgi:hypothetical protein